MKRIISIALAFAMLLSISSSFALPLSAEGIDENASEAVTTVSEDTTSVPEMTAEADVTTEPEVTTEAVSEVTDSETEVAEPEQGVSIAFESNGSDLYDDTIDTIGTENPTEQELIWEYHVEPLYAGLVTEADPLIADNTESKLSASFENISAAGEYIRNNLANRVEDFEFTLNTPCKSVDFFDEAYRHTGNPLHGDSIRYQSYLRVQYNSIGTYFRLYPQYYTTAEQEAELTAKINSVMSGLNLSGKSDYEKVCAIYDYICKNVVYDYEHLNQSDYNLMYTAYAAMINGTSVCQGYATLFYRMCLEAGVDNRIITGNGNGGGHAWNIVKVGDLYYNCDATWDEGNGDRYFLKGSSSFEDHIRNEEYTTNLFNAEYPTSPVDYSNFTSICTVIFDPGEGDMSSQRSYIIEKGKSFANSEKSLPCAARANGIFDGWYDDPIAGTKLKKNTIIYEDKTYYAHWKESTENIAEASLTDIRGRSISTKSDGTKKVLIFGDLKWCTITQARMKEIARSTHAYRDDVIFIFLQIKDFPDGKQVLDNFAKENNCGDNFYFCDYLQAEFNSNRLCWKCIWELYPGINTFTMPFIMVINEDNRCVSAGATGFLTMEMVYETLGESTAPPHIVASGYCGGEGDGTNLTWKIESDGKLTISGKGKMADFGYPDIPFMKYNDYCTEVVIENGVTSIGNNVFFGCSGLADISIPDSVTSIGACAFTDCEKLTGIIIPDSVTSIGYYAFQHCNAMTGITIPNSVTKIGSGAFYSCDGLTSITIPRSVTVMGSAVFEDCSGLTDIICEIKAQPRDWNYNWNGSNAEVHWGDAEVVDYISGDFNEDGVVDMKDAAHFIGWVGAPFLPQFQINQDFNADFNKDGTIDMKDAAHFIGWVGAPFLPQFKIDWQ